MVRRIYRSSIFIGSPKIEGEKIRSFHRDLRRLKAPSKSVAISATFPSAKCRSALCRRSLRVPDLAEGSGQ